MVFKINVSHKGKVYKVETENEFLVGKKIGEKIEGSVVDDSLKGYELEITGTSDLSGIPGFKGLEGSGYHRQLLTYGKGMKNREKGLRLRKSSRGEEISLKTHQVNIKVLKEGDVGFGELGGSESGGSEGGEDKEGSDGGTGDQVAPVEDNKEEGKKEEVKEEKVEEKKEEVKG
jgi:small subunit ribosomal protein S6e|tara:strand:+ start:1923 stop:2444 length:522 start_codon:yes stop_codon:yes gene_type:complete